MGRTLDLTLKGTEEQREDRWVVKCLELGIIVYGHTQKEAQGSFFGAVQALVISFGDDDDELTAWLDKKHVNYRLQYGSKEELMMPDAVFEHEPIPFRERLRVAVGAPA